MKKAFIFIISSWAFVCTLPSYTYSMQQQEEEEPVAPEDSTQEPQVEERSPEQLLHSLKYMALMEEDIEETSKIAEELKALIAAGKITEFSAIQAIIVEMRKNIDLTTRNLAYLQGQWGGLGTESVGAMLEKQTLETYKAILGLLEGILKP